MSHGLRFVVFLCLRYGMGRNLYTTMDPLLRFQFSPQTAPIDVCGPDPGMAGPESATAAPGVGQLEKAGLGVKVPVRETGLP